MSTRSLGLALLRVAARTDPENPQPENVIRLVLRAAHNYGSCAFTGLLKRDECFSDLMVLQPGRFVAQWSPEGEEMPPAWQQSSLPVWIPTDSILYVEPGDAS